MEEKGLFSEVGDRTILSAKGMEEIEKDYIALFEKYRPAFATGSSFQISQVMGRAEQKVFAEELEALRKGEYPA